MKTKSILLMMAVMFSTVAFSQVYDMGSVPYRSGNKWGFSTPQKSMTIPAKYDEVNWFSEGYAAVRVGNKWGYIDKTGKMVIPAKFTVAKEFRKGYLPNKQNNGGDTILFAGASVREDKYEVCINTKGQILDGCPAREEDETKIATTTEKKVYTVANDGFYDVIEDDYQIDGETYYIAKKNGMYGVFNTKFEMLLPFEYSSIKQADAAGTKYLVVSKNGMYGLNTYMGKEMMTPVNTKMTVVNDPMKKGYVIVQENGLTYVKNLDGSRFMDRGFGDITYDELGGFVVVGDNNLKGFYFPDNRYVAPKYSEVHMVPGGQYIWVKTYSGNGGYVNGEGNEYFDN